MNPRQGHDDGVISTAFLKPRGTSRCELDYLGQATLRGHAGDVDPAVNLAPATPLQDQQLQRDEELRYHQNSEGEDPFGHLCFDEDGAAESLTLVTLPTTMVPTPTCDSLACPAEEDSGIP